jgi:nitrite reductase/ring-hydroxylating ferredoxin subunit/catechol 2,3-dioxygenase-like lactoylglutathione lyase family enzyme
MISEIAAVTLSVADLDRARRVFVGGLGFEVDRSWELDQDADEARLWGGRTPVRGRALFLRQPGAPFGALRIVALDPPSPRCVGDGARPYDHGYLKNLDFFTDDVARLCARLKEQGVEFPAPPVEYALPWGGQKVTEAHTRKMEGFKLAVARLQGAPRKAMGEASPAGVATEVAAATQIVGDYDRAVDFYTRVFDCVPAAETVVEDPALTLALNLPPGTRLRMCFIGHKAAIGGKVGLVAYEGPGLADRSAVEFGSRPPNRGAVGLTFETDEIDSRYARALALGAAEVTPPRDATLHPWGAVRAASFLSPDGVLHEFVDRGVGLDWFAVLDASTLEEGSMRGIPGVLPWGRVLLARVAGQVLAWRDRCPHAGGPLSQGSIEGGRVICPWHGWRVDLVTGCALGGHGSRASSVPVREREGRLELGRPRS